MSNSVTVNFSNGGTWYSHYVTDNAALQAELGGVLTGTPAAPSDVSNGDALGDINPLMTTAYSNTGSLDEAFYFGVNEWNSVKNISAAASGDSSILFIADNFVHADLDFSGVTDTVELRVFNGKRSNILTGEGDDRVEITTATNKASWSNEHRLNTGDGNDEVVIKAGDLSGGELLNFVDGSLTTIKADLGAGNDEYGVDEGVKTKDHVNAGDGSDVVFTGAGKDRIEGGMDDGVIVYDEEGDIYNLLADGDILEGGADADRFIYNTGDAFANLGDGFDFIVDFADEDVLVMNTQDDNVVTTETVDLSRTGDAEIYSGTMVFVNGDASVFLNDFTNTSEIFA